MNEQLADHIKKAIKGCSMEEKKALCDDLQSANNVPKGISYDTLLRYLRQDHFILTVPHNQAAIRKHLQIPESTPILAHFKNGKWVADAAIESVNN